MRKKWYIRIPPYLKDLDVGQDLSFETLFTKELAKSIVSESMEQSDNEGISYVER